MSVKLIITGSRDLWVPYDTVDEMVRKYIKGNVTEIVCCGEEGVDRCAEDYARRRGIRCVVYRPDWSYGPGADAVRDREVASYGSAAVVILKGGRSRGSLSVIQEMDVLGKPVVIRYTL